jgi:hypothetical protein
MWWCGRGRSAIGTFGGLRHQPAELAGTVKAAVEYRASIEGDQLCNGGNTIDRAASLRARVARSTGLPMDSLAMA